MNASFNDPTPSDFTPDTEVDADTSGEDPEQIRQDIEQTRADMTDTIDAIQEKLDPERLKDEAKQALRDSTIGKAEDFMQNVEDTAIDTGQSIWDTIRANPLPSALVAIGLGWLYMSRDKGQQTYPSNDGGYRSRPTTRFVNYPQYSGQYGRGYRTGYTTSGYQQDQGGSFTEEAKDKASQMASQVGDTAQDLTDDVQAKAGELADQVGTQFNEFTDQAQYQYQNMQSKLSEMFDQNPLAMGAVAMGVGAAVGLLVPETSKEDQWFGEARDTVLEKAENVAQEGMDKVQGAVAGATNTESQSQSPASTS